MEYVIFETPSCNVFKLPPKKATAYKAEDWEGHNIWAGTCRVVSTDEMCFIRLIDDKTGKLFAQCPVTSDPNGPKSVESVSDSSRYFVLRVENEQTKQHAFIGIGFEERSQAFDFSVALSDFKKSVQQAKERATKGDYVAKDIGDMTLKSGEKITVSLGGKVKTGEKTNTNTTVTAKLGGGLAPPPGRTGGLAPPPGRSPTTVTAPPQPQEQTTNKTNTFSPTTSAAPVTQAPFDPFGNSSGFTSSQPQPSQPQSSSFDPFGNSGAQSGTVAPSFDPFGSGSGGFGSQPTTTKPPPPSSTFGNDFFTSTAPAQPPAPPAATKAPASMDDLFKF